MKEAKDTRLRNPFHDLLVTELIDDPQLYRKMFSQEILVGETLQVFQPANVALLGPQGSGKSMVLNLVRYSVLSEWILPKSSKLPQPLRGIKPFFGISLNLARIHFQAFGRRSMSRAMNVAPVDLSIDLSCAADFLNHYLFREFLAGMAFLTSPKGQRFRRWAHIDAERLSWEEIAKLRDFDSWFGYYADCHSLEELRQKCDRRISIWRSFLNANVDMVPDEVWRTKAPLGDPLHGMGNFLNYLARGHDARARLPLFVVIDQYEVLPELNPAFGTHLQRLVNTLVKARDPVVFFKIGARTYDWGRELRIWGSESRIEIQRDYVVVNLADVLVRQENTSLRLFRELAKDVARRRIRVEGHYYRFRRPIEDIFGSWDEHSESRKYFRDPARRHLVLRHVPGRLQRAIIAAGGQDPSPLELRLAGAWVLQQLRRRRHIDHIEEEIAQHPWRRAWWRKERVGIALLQVASIANQRKYYYGWQTLSELSGANISSFLLLFGEIWDKATKRGLHPLKGTLSAAIQTEGVLSASETWRMRDRLEANGGRRRYDVLNRLGPAIHKALIADLAISNPGHSGFSVRESELIGSQEGERVFEFLGNAVSWSIFEERAHTSKERESFTRRKYFLHTLLSPSFSIPYIRVKEPLYVGVAAIYSWFFNQDEIDFRRWTDPAEGKSGERRQATLPFE